MKRHCLAVENGVLDRVAEPELLDEPQALDEEAQAPADVADGEDGAEGA
jgi:hypothetical protein